MIFNPVDSALCHTEPLGLRYTTVRGNRPAFRIVFVKVFLTKRHLVTSTLSITMSKWRKVNQRKADPDGLGLWFFSLFWLLFVLCFFGGPESQSLLGTMTSRQRPYCVENTGSLPNSEVKHRKARIVLGWVTAREVLRVLLAFFIALLFFIYTLSGWKPCDIFLHYIYVGSCHMSTIYTFNRTDSDWTLEG